jgi:hypothetical protein
VLLRNVPSSKKQSRRQDQDQEVLEVLEVLEEEQEAEEVTCKSSVSGHASSEWREWQSGVVADSAWSQRRCAEKRSGGSGRG